MKKIAILYSGDSRGLNGAALYVDRFRKYNYIFKSYGIEPVICDYNTVSSNAKTDDEITEVETIYANSKKHHLKNQIKEILSNTYTGSKLFIRYAWECPGLKAVECNKTTIEAADIILANDMYCAYNALKLFPEKDIFFVMHNSGDLLKMLLDRLPTIKGRKKEAELKKIEFMIFKKAKGVVFVSRKARETFIKSFPQYKSKAYYIPEGIEDLKTIPLLDFSTIKLICVGTVCDRKNQLELVKAFEKYKSNNIRLSIVGGGSLLEQCKSYALEKGIDNVIFVGPVKNSEIPELLSKANIFILVSKDEGLPAVGIEALRSGLPILISDVGGCAELVKNNGFVLTGVDANSIERGIEYIISQKNKLSEMSHNSRTLYEQEFSIEAMVAAYKKIFMGDDYGE